MTPRQKLAAQFLNNQGFQTRLQTREDHHPGCPQYTSPGWEGGYCSCKGQVTKLQYLEKGTWKEPSHDEFNEYVRQTRNKNI